MNTTIKLLIAYRNSKSNDLFNELVVRLSEYVLFNLESVPSKYKERVVQERLFDIYKTTFNFQFNYDCVLNFNSFSIENYILLERKDYKNINNILKHNYLDEFIYKYGSILLKRSFFDLDAREDFIYEYFLFCNENRLIKYLKDKFQYTFKNILREEKKLTSIYLDDNINYKVVIYESPKKIDLKQVLIDSNFENEDIEFLLSYIENDELLSDEKLAKKLGISQQAVCSKKNRIIKKYRNQ